MFGVVRKFRDGSILLALLLSLPGCVGLGTLADVMAGDILNGGRDLSGEISRIDSRRQEIELRSGWGGNERIRYDGRTQVLYRQQRYSVRDLERGDVVRVLLTQNRDGRLIADRIQVQQSTRDRRDTSRSARARVERISGSVRRIEARAGWFELQPSRGSTLRVSLPARADRSLSDRLQRLRKGQRVQIQGEPIGNGRVVLVRFD